MTNNILCIMLCLKQPHCLKSIWRKKYYLFVPLKSIAGLQLLGAMTGLIKEVINRSSGGPQGGGAEMGGGKREKKIKIIAAKSFDAEYL